MFGNKLIGAAYARFSREDEGFSIASQLRDIKRYAADAGIELAYILQDDNVSGALRPDERPGMSKIYRLMKERRINAIIVFDATRLARRVGVAEQILDDTFNAGVQLHLVSWEKAVRDTAKDRDSFYHDAVYADIEKRKIRERTMRGRLEKITGTEETPQLPLGQGLDLYGYQTVGSKRNTRLEIIPQEAEAIRYIFHAYAIERRGTEEIARELNAKNYPTPSQARNRFWHLRATWDRKMIHRIIRETAYIGVFQPLKNIKVNGQNKPRPKDQWIRQDFPQYRIVDQDVFDAANKLLETRGNDIKQRTIYPYLLNTRLRCACDYATGSTNRGTRNEPYTYYICDGKKNKVAPNCPVPNYPTQRIDKAVWDCVELLIRQPEVVLQELREAQQQQMEQHRSALDGAETLERAKARYVQEIDRLTQLYQRGLIDLEAFERNAAPIKRRYDDAVAVQKEYDDTIAKHVLTDRDIKAIVHECHRMSDLLDEIGILEYEHKKRIIELLNIRGRFIIKDRTIVLVITIHDLAFDRLSLGILDGTSECSGDYSYHSKALTFSIVIENLTM